MTQEIPVHESSGNVFADLDLPNPEEMLIKAQLARLVNDALAQQNLTQTEAAQILGIDQPKVSALMRGKLAGFSLERLLRFVNLLGQDVEIVVKPKSQERTQARIVVI